jgi:hypothetical protein
MASLILATMGCFEDLFNLQLSSSRHIIPLTWLYLGTHARAVGGAIVGEFIVGSVIDCDY